MKIYSSLMLKLPKWALLVVMFLGSIAMATAQVTVSGTVTDGQTPIPGVTIMEQGTTKGTLSDFDGKYTITVANDNSVLLFSSIGFKTQTVKVGTQTTINIQLAEEISQLDEVVVVGYGVMKRKDLTGASVSVSSDQITNVPVTTAAQALTGKAAGVSVVTQSGAPGADINILVRGGTSITQSTQPLYIVDGFQMEKGLQNIDINDIESIDIMKDASATAIYGARGSNGVILITTKSGKKGKTEVNYNAYYSFESLGKRLDILSVEDYVKYQFEFQSLSGNTAKWASMFGGDTNAADFYTGAYGRIAQEYGSREGIDWQNLVFGGSAMAQNHNLSITGGNESTRYMLSYNFTGQDGIVENYGYLRNSIRTKINHEISKNIRLDFSSSLQQTQVDGGGSLGGMLKMTILQPVTGGVRYTNEQMIDTDISDEMLGIDSQYDVFNPIITNAAVSNQRFTRMITTNAGLEIDFLKDFTFRTAGSYSWQQVRTDYWDDGRTKTAQNFGGPYGKRNNSERTSWQITNTLSWKKTIGVHSFNALLGQETYFQESMKLDNEYHYFPENNFGLNDISMGTYYSGSSGKSREGIVSAFGRLVYNYDSRYLLSASYRGDGSAKFEKGNQWGFFPSASAAWRISEEAFWENMQTINNLKLRVGFGTSGNCNIDNNMYATDYESGRYAIGNAEYATLVPGNTVGNRFLKWETVTSTNLGLDVSAFKSRLNLTLDLYNNTSENLLIRNKIPTSTGYSFQFQNIGSISNRGIELIINSYNIKKKDFTWTTDFNISFNRSKVLSIYGLEGKNDYFIQNYDSRIDFLVKAGESLGQFYGYKYAGVYTTDDFEQNENGNYTLKNGVQSLKGKARSSLKPGDVKYHLRELTDADDKHETDANGNPVWSTNDRGVIGSAEPKFIGGINNTFIYKGFDLGIFMNFSYGNQIFNMNSQRFIGPYLPNQNTMTVMNDRYVLVDPSTGVEATNLSRLAELNPQQYDEKAMWSLHSDNKIAITDALDYYLEDGSYLRISNITLGYSLPKDLLRKAHISNVRIYGTLNNIYTFTNYSGYDPEVSATSSLLTRGVDNSGYPRAKSIVFGVNLTF